jgi:hypothetical protein
VIDRLTAKFPTEPKVSAAHGQKDKSSCKAATDKASNPELEELLMRAAMTAVEAYSSRRRREDLIPGVRLASERELRSYTPWSAKKIKAMRGSGLLKPVNADASGHCKGEPLYNLYDVWAVINQQQPGWRQGIRRIPDDLEVKVS